MQEHASPFNTFNRFSEAINAMRRTDSFVVAPMCGVAMKFSSVSSRPAQLAGLQPIIQRRLIHQFAARRVDDERAVFHLRDASSVDEIGGFRLNNYTSLIVFVIALVWLLWLVKNRPGRELVVEGPEPTELPKADGESPEDSEESADSAEDEHDEHAEKNSP